MFTMQVLSKQKLVQQADLGQVQSTAQRQRALALMCRLVSYLVDRR